MDTAKLSKVLYEIAKPLGYRRKGNLFWKKGPELTMLIHLQRSQWCPGVYVNFGITPTAMVTRSVAPPVGYWGKSDRALNLESPFRDAFDRLEMDIENKMAPEEMADAFRWLLSYLESTYGDAEAFRAKELAELAVRDFTGCIIPDWAKRTLKEPSEYWKGFRVPYYSKST
jgi:hypothetical protein